MNVIVLLAQNDKPTSPKNVQLEWKLISLTARYLKKAHSSVSLEIYTLSHQHFSHWTQVFSLTHSCFASNFCATMDVLSQKNKQQKSCPTHNKVVFVLESNHTFTTALRNVTYPWFTETYCDGWVVKLQGVCFIRETGLESLFLGYLAVGEMGLSVQLDIVWTKSAGKFLAVGRASSAPHGNTQPHNTLPDCASVISIHSWPASPWWATPVVPEIRAISISKR